MYLHTFEIKRKLCSSLHGVLYLLSVNIIKYEYKHIITQLTYHCLYGLMVCICPGRTSGKERIV